MKNSLELEGNGHKINSVAIVLDTWMCWDPGEGESKVESHGWTKIDCFSRKQRHDASLSQGMVERSLCGVKCRMHELADSTPLLFFSRDLRED